jgi:L-cysteine desulfidase
MMMVGAVGVVAEVAYWLSLESLGIIDTCSILGDFSGVICDAGLFWYGKVQRRVQQVLQRILW